MLEEIIIPESVTNIGEYAFRNCHSLTSIIIPDSVKEINYNAFLWCYELTIYCEAQEKPIAWDSEWHGSTQVYWADEWRYDENNIPVPLT